MFFSPKIASASLAENICTCDSIKLCAVKLRQECKDFDFGFTEKFHDATELSKFIKKYDTEKT